MKFRKEVKADFKLLLPFKQTYNNGDGSNVNPVVPRVYGSAREDGGA